MTGVPSSKGCSLCLKRKVKCDEGWPTCQQCRIGGRKCPGYRRQMKFVNEGTKFQGRRKTARSSRQQQCPRPISKETVAPPPPQPLPSSSQVYAAPLCIQSPRAELDQQVACFVAAMFPLGLRSVQASLLGSWLWHVPPRLGQSLPLDLAARAVSLAYFAGAMDDELALRNAKLTYAAALPCLAAALDDSNRKFDGEVLCATMLLGHYESLDATSSGWIRHAGGASNLMRLRGARQSYESAFEYSMFLTCRSAIISQATLLREPCFLEEAAWQSIPDGLIEFPLLPQNPQLYHEIFNCFAVIPGLLKCFGAESEAKATDLRRRMKTWYIHYTTADDGKRNPVEAQLPALTDDVSFDGYVFYDTLSATTIVAYYAYLILLNQAIDSNSGTNMYDEENDGLAISLYKSADYCAQAGYCGMQTLKLVLPIAESIVDKALAIG